MINVIKNIMQLTPLPHRMTLNISNTFGPSRMRKWAVDVGSDRQQNQPIKMEDTKQLIDQDGTVVSNCFVETAEGV